MLPIYKHCIVCGKDFEDHSKNRAKKTCSRHCRQLVYNGDRTGVKDRHYRVNYGITVEQYNALFEQQNGCCPICGKHQSEFKRAFAVDHDHKTGNIRGLLCSHCNSILGKASDDPNIFLRAIEYLESEGVAVLTDIIDQERARQTRDAMVRQVIETRQWKEEIKKAREEMVDTFLRGGYSDN